MSRSEIEVSTIYQASHHWPNAHDQRAYLRHVHVHDFKITVWAKVTHGDRDIEFHDLRLRLTNATNSLGRVGPIPVYGVVPHIGSMSCEQIGERLLQDLPEVYKVRVMEDESVGATVERDESHKPDQSVTRTSIPQALGMDRLVETHRFKHYRSRPKIVTLCGSTRFKEQFREAEAKFENEGVCVFTVGFFAHADSIPIGEEAKIAADELHKWKISMSDSIFVVNPGGYIGSSTRSEIDFANSVGVRVEYLIKPE